MRHFTRYLVVLLSLIFVFPSCEEDALFKEARERKSKSEIKTRSLGISVTSIEGPKELIVGQTYTYKVKLSQAITDYTEYMVSGISQNLMIKYQNLWIDSPVLSIVSGKSEISFEVLAIGAKKNASISIYSQKGNTFTAKIDGITITNPQFSIEGPTGVMPDSEFVLSAYYKNGSSSGRELRSSYNGSNFILESGPNFNTVLSKYEVRYKARSNTASNQNFTFEIVGTYKGRYNANYNYSIAKAEHTVNILRTFEFNTSITSDVICPGTEIICEMPNYKLLSNAHVKWIANDGFILKSGQNTGKAVFVVSDEYNGYSHISVTGTYNGKNYNETSKEFWIGKPKVEVEYLSKKIINREYHGMVEIVPYGPNVSVNWKLLSGNAELLNPSRTSVCVKSNAMESVRETISVAVELTNECGVTTQNMEILVAKTPPIVPDLFCITTLDFDGRTLRYQVIYKATKPYSFKSLYTMILYKGTYDNSLFTDWQWQEGSYGYLPPSIPLEYGSTCYHDSCWGSPHDNISITPGNSIYHEASIELHPTKKISDIEYLIVYYIDGLGNRLHYDMYDFVDFMEYLQ